MSLKLSIDDNNLLTLTISGKYLYSDFQQLNSEAEQIFKTHKDMDLLVIFDQFEGWEDNEHWSETDFEDQAAEYIRKVAIVAEIKWQPQIEMFGLMDFQNWPFKFFTPEQSSEARRWLA